jgi:ligand-binding sensor domain-containing protein
MENFYVRDIQTIYSENGNIWIGTSEYGLVKRNSEGKIIHTYNQASSGLINNSINCITIDNEYKKWIGTEKGISIFDGFEWNFVTKKEGLSSNKIKTLLATENNILYIGTDNGLDVYDISEQEIIKSINKTDGLSSNIITSLAIDENNSLWIGSISGVDIYDGEDISSLQAPDSINLSWINSIEIKEDDVWIGSDNGLIHFDGNTFEFFDSNNNLLSNEIKDIAISSDSLWLATNNAITLYKDSSFTHFHKENSNLLTNSYQAIRADNKGSVWAGNFKALSKYSSGKWSNYRELKSNDIRNSTKFRNILWFSTKNGLTVHNEKHWETFTIKDGLIDNAVNDMSVDKEYELWIGTESGVTNIGNNSVENYTTQDGLIDENIKCIAVDSSGRKWFGTPSGISLYDGNQWHNFTTNESKLESNNITDIETDPDGVVWISTSNGVNSYKDETFNSYSTEEGLINDSVNTIFIDSLGRKWFGTQDGISIYNDTSWSDFTGKDELSFSSITAIGESSECGVLIGGKDGFAVYKNDTLNLITQNDGLASNIVQTIVCQNDQIWIGTKNGLTKMERIINHAPTNITSAQSKIKESFKAGSTVTKLIAEDPDPNNMHKFELVGEGEDNHLFSILKNDLVTTQSTDYEQKQSYNLKIKTTDEYGKSFTKSLSLTVTNMAPEFSDNYFTMKENREEGYKVGTIALNHNKDTNSVNFEIIDGNIDEAFSIDSKSHALEVNKPSLMDYESYKEFNLKTKVTDGKYSDTTNIEIHLENILIEGFNVKFIVENTSEDYIGNTEVELDGYGSLETFSNGQVIFGSVQPNTDIQYIASASGYKSDTGFIKVENQNLEKTITLKKKQSNKNDEDSDTVSTAISHINPDEIHIYPNPALDRFYVKVKNTRNKRIIIKNIKGITVFNKKMNKNNYKISGFEFNSGLYIVEIKGRNSSVRKKMIIK